MCCSLALFTCSLYALLLLPLDFTNFLIFSLNPSQAYSLFKSINQVEKNMKAKKGSVVLVAVLLIVLLLVPPAMPARNMITRQRSPHTDPTHVGQLGTGGGGAGKAKRRRPETLEIAGSSLPDCSHACGSCSPCRLVMVRFFCAAVEESETCPMAYKCMCSNKSFPVP